MSSSAGGKPRKRTQILRSGNAGNSSKSTAGSSSITPPDQDRPPPLFPPGSKTPIQLLQERCRHNQWEKPVIETKRRSEGYTGVVTLAKKDKKDASLRHTVRLEPHPPLNRQSTEEAKHWVATYALFRFCNNMPLHRMLPPGPKEYWITLEQEKKLAPAHRDWEFSTDPFQAADEVKKRQELRELKNEKSVNSSTAASQHEENRPLPRDWSLAPEVKMNHALRERIEQIVRSLLAQFPSAQTDDPTSLALSPHAHQTSPLEDRKLSNELIQMGFRPGHVFSALKHLSKIRNVSSDSTPSNENSHVARLLMKSFQGSSDRDTLLQYLTVVVPEDDLPIRFRPTQKSTSFITAISGGKGDDSKKNDLEIKWMVERLNKLYGFPLDAILTTLKGSVGVRDGVLLETLTRRLAAWDVATPLAHANIADTETDEAKEMVRARDERRAMEKEALESIYGNERYRIVPEAPETDFELLVSPQSQKPQDLWLRISFHRHSLYPTSKDLISTASIPTFSIVSSTVPSYLRLSLMKEILEQFSNPKHPWSSMLDVGEGNVVFEMMNYIEERWPVLATNPPDVADVMCNFLVGKHPIEASALSSVPSGTPPTAPIGSLKQQILVRALKRLPEVDAQLKKEQHALATNPLYEPVLRGRQSLPAWSSRAEFLNCLADPTIRVVVVAGETGSGKTTQLPQFVLESELEVGRGSLVNILCTQPRRVSAIGVATRVASERLENIDDESGVVGYAIRGEKKNSSRTKLLFVTSGILVRRLATSDPDLLGISHLFIDEVHERSIDVDLLLLELRELLNRNSKIKIILMSATANQDFFANYFGTDTQVNIPGVTYPVKDLYLEDYLKLLDYSPANAGARSNRQEKPAGPLQKKQADELDKQFQAIGYSPSESRFLIAASGTSHSTDEKLIASIVSHILKESASIQGDKSLGGILIFVSGVAEIGCAIKAIKDTCKESVECLPLHSNLSSAEQKRVFRPVSSSKTKVVVATNIAETSITIPNVRYVIDSGREKQTALDENTGMSRLVEVNCSQAAAKQRRGRAGRTTSGVAYKLFTKTCEIEAMPIDTKPEILRTPLDSLFLQIKAIREKEDVPIFLQKALTPPSQLAMDRAIENLEVVGALHDGSLTALGKHLAQLPLDVRLGKLLVLGAIFKVFEPTLTLAAMLSVSKPLFFSPFDQREECNLSRLKFKIGNSDLLTNINAFDEVIRIQRESGITSARSFCNTNFMSMSTIQDIMSSRSELLSQVKERGFVPKSYGRHSNSLLNPTHDHHSEECDLNKNSQKLNLVKSVFAAGLSQIVRIDVPEAKYGQVVSGTIEKDVESKAVKFYDQNLGRVFLHPSSILFKLAKELKTGFLTYFSRSVNGSDTNSKIFLRDGTTVPLFGILLLFGSGSIKLNYERNGLSIQTRFDKDNKRGTDHNEIKLRAPMRIGTLCNQLRHLLDSLLLTVVDQPEQLVAQFQGQLVGRQVIECVIDLIESDGLELSLHNNYQRST